MAAMDAGVMITGSQKALACAPGIAVMILAPSAIKRIEKVQCCCQYLDLKLALKIWREGRLLGLLLLVSFVKLMSV